MKLVKPLIMISALGLSCSGLAAENVSYDFEGAEKDRQERESIGIVGGLLAGAAVAGPPGAIVGAAFGGLLGNKRHSTIEKESLTASLQSTQAQLLALQAEQAQLEQQYHAAIAQQQRAGFLNTTYSTRDQEVADCCTDSAIALHFKTNSSNIETHYLTDLKALADLSQNNPETVIEVLGFADRRGTSISNMSLSRNRVNAVIRTLVDMGVDVHSIQSSAFGEDRPLADSESIEDNFFDRRVNIRIRPAGTELLSLSE